MNYSWPGNVREPRNLMKRIVIMTTHGDVGVGELGLSNNRRPGEFGRMPRFSSLEEARKAYERDYVLMTLEQLGGNMTRTAEALGLERSHLYRKMKALGISQAE